jgi:hypothetical protein
MVALGIGSTAHILYVQNSGTLFQFTLGGVLSTGKTYRVILESNVASGLISIIIYENGVLFSMAAFGIAAIGALTVDSYGIRNGGGGSSQKVVGSIASIEIDSTLETAALDLPTTSIGIKEPFNSGDMRIKTPRVIAAGTEIKAAVSIDGGAFSAFININTTPVAGLTGVYQFTAGTAFTPAVDAIIKLQINSPSGSIQIEVSTPWIDGVTASAACDYPVIADVRDGVDYDSGNLTGTLAVPAASDVREGVAVDAGTGTYEPADEADVLLNVQYGAGGTEKTGSLLRYAVETDANDDLRTRIMEVLDTRLRTILIANNFVTDMGLHVSEWRDHEYRAAELPALKYKDLRSVPEQLAVGVVEHSLEVEIQVTAKGSTSPATMRLMLADVKKAIMADEYFSQLAEGVILPSDFTEVRQAASKFIEATLTIMILYSTDRLNPYS